MKKRTGFLFMIVVFLSVNGFAAGKGGFLSVRDNGAIGDGKIMDTRAIQKTIDAVAQGGGGTVYFPSGRYLTGTIVLKDAVTLNLDAGATLLGSKLLQDYPVMKPQIRSYTDNYADRSLIYAENVRDIAITGQGTIDGQGDAYKQKEYMVRPFTIRFVGCENVSVTDVKMQNSAMWMQHYLACTNLVIRGITVNNFVAYNNDGIDIDSCRDVRISDCSIFSDDDGICLKSTTLSPCVNVAITNCVIGSHCNAIKMGTESNGGFKNIAISNCVVRSPQTFNLIGGVKRGLAGIALEVVDGGVMDGVTISNISMEGITSPIFIRLGNRARPYTVNSPKSDIGILRNVLIQDIVGTGASKTGCAITGVAERFIEKVTLKNIQLSFEGGGTLEEASRPVAAKPADYPECTMFGALPSYGFFCRNINGLTIDGLRLSYDKIENRPALICDEVNDLTLNLVKSKPASTNVPVNVFNQVNGGRFMNSIAEQGTGIFLFIQSGSEDVYMNGNDLRNAKTAMKSVTK